MKKSPNLATKLRIAIEGAIVSGEYPLGAPLEDQVLAKRFGTSRTPVREALLQLAAEGLVEIRPRSGTYVAKPTVKYVLGVIECLAIFEASAARFAARRMTLEERQELSRMMDHLSAVAPEGSSVVSRADYEERNSAFHEAIYAGCANAVLAQQIRAMRLRVATWGRSFFETNNRIHDSIQEHSEIAQAIVDGDEAVAAERMFAHISAGGRPLADLLLRLSD
jgi:DNA-binding GntR family transcriptional regulator